MSTEKPVLYEASELQRYNPRLVLTVLFRRRWIFWGVFLPIFLFGVWGTLSSTDSFTARSQILIQTRSIETPEFRHLPVDNDVLLSTAVQVVQSIPVAERAATALADTFAQFKRDFPDEFGMVETERDLRDLVMSGLDASQIGESNVVEIIYSHALPEFAAVVVSAVTESFLEYSVESKQNLKALDYYSEQITEVEDEIAQMMEKRLAVFSDGGLNAYKENNSSGLQHMRAVEYDYFKAKSRSAGMRQKYNGIVAAVAADPLFVPAVTSGGQNANLIGARQVYDEAVLELARVGLTYKNDSEFVLRQKKYVESARDIFVGIRDAYVMDLAIELDVVASEEQELHKSLDEYRGNLLEYPALERRLYSVDLEIESQKDLLEALQLKRGEIRLKAFGDQRISNVTRLNEATVDFGIQGGKKVIYLLLITFLGFVLSLIACLVVDGFDHRIYDIHQAETQLDLPVLGAISAIDLPARAP